MEIVNGSSSGWACVRDVATKKEGYFPKELLKPSPVVQQQSQGQQAESQQKTGVVTDDYKGDDDTQLSLTAGTNVFVIDMTDPDWAYVKTVDTGDEGYFPKELIRL